MNSKCVLCLPLAAVGILAAFQHSADNLSFHVKSGTALLRSFESRQEVSQDDVEMLLNGQPIPTGEHGMTLIQTQALEIVDEFGSVEGAQPKSLKRRFQKIDSSGEQTTKNPMDAGQQDAGLQRTAESRRRLAVA